MRESVREVIEGYEPQRMEGDALVPAAVMVLLYERDGEEHLLFQVRTHHVEHHKGEISLPGGAQDPEDATLLMTALRETEEEIGVAAGDIEIYGQLDDTPTRSNFVMSPFVGAITAPAPYPFAFAEIEVAELLEVPLNRLLSGEALEWTEPRPGTRMPAFRHGEHLIFGATARVIDRFVRLIGPALGAEPLPTGDAWPTQ
ncbi:MAG: CoA pyrophosphatase [Chloroflexi bacterium]|nr:CoA pyrophosphatase [Chloroflexota bacterium]